ncbi:hypothetical protein J19TS2_19390 [Cohnella xylanilytica]|uniref:DUF2759 family protein n=1 Tax=Cohnella xylanilytica TaxID=557555 RepID=A0A841TTT3_9BACL|nr:hypothetical protein [Cohnella xylanilytica]MBB6690488.1 hypothetical protein [Cohnella xylanilytica]GIO12384.1 hypothetical protein J19TS2_19390 [Cohnella xylanilytica]
MFLAANAEESASLFTPFDIFMVIFTVLIAIGIVRLLMARPKKNFFAIGFGLVALIVFLIADVKMVSGW